jgi:hypothetical protein
LNCQHNQCGKPNGNRPEVSAMVHRSQYLPEPDVRSRGCSRLDMGAGRYRGGASMRSELFEACRSVPMPPPGGEGFGDTRGEVRV